MYHDELNEVKRRMYHEELNEVERIMYHNELNEVRRRIHVCSIVKMYMILL